MQIKKKIVNDGFFVCTYSAFTTGFKLGNKMDDFSNHLSARDAQETPKTRHGVQVWVDQEFRYQFSKLIFYPLKTMLWPFRLIHSHKSVYDYGL